MDEASHRTPARLAGQETRRADHDRTLAAMHELEAALGAAAPGRESSWHARVVAALAVLDDATAEEHANATSPDSLLADIRRTQPRLRTRVRGLLAQTTQLRRAITVLRAELADVGDDEVDVADLRRRTAWLLTAMRHQQARESDLIYEAYYDAFDTEIGAEWRR